MFDISWGKLVIIGVVALLVIGPKELPTVLRTVGQWMTKIRRMASEFQGQFQEAMREAEMADLKKQFDDTTSSLTSALDPSGFKADMEKLIEDPLATSSAGTPATANQTSMTADPVALGTAPVAPEPAVDVPMPELPPPAESKDFATAPAPAQAPEAGGGKAA